jgi:hypothetical protein
VDLAESSSNSPPVLSGTSSRLVSLLLLELVVNFGSSGTLLSQLAHRHTLFIPFLTFALEKTAFSTSKGHTFRRTTEAKQAKMMIVASALAVALLCLAPTNAFVNTQNTVVTRGEPLSSLVMDRTDVFRPASTHPNTYLPGAPSSSQGIGYGVSSYGQLHGYGHGYGYNSHDYDRYNRYGTRSVNDRSYNSYNNNYYSSSPSRYGYGYGSSYGYGTNDWNGVRRINTAGTNYNGARSTWDNDVYGTGRSTYNRNYNTGYGNYNTNYNTNNRYYNNGYRNNNDWYNNNYSNRYTSGYGNYGTYNNNDYSRTGSYYGTSGYNNYYNSDRYNNNNYGNWNSLSRNNYYGRGTYDLDIDRRGAFEAGSTLASYSRPSRTALQLQGYGYNSGYSLSADQPKAFNPGYNWKY